MATARSMSIPRRWRTSPPMRVGRAPKSNSWTTGRPCTSTNPRKLWRRRWRIRANPNLPRSERRGLSRAGVLFGRATAEPDIKQFADRLAPASTLAQSARAKLRTGFSRNPPNMPGDRCGFARPGEAGSCTPAPDALPYTPATHEPKLTLPAPHSWQLRAIGESDAPPSPGQSPPRPDGRPGRRPAAADPGATAGWGGASVANGHPTRAGGRGRGPPDRRPERGGPHPHLSPGRRVTLPGAGLFPRRRMADG